MIHINRYTFNTDAPFFSIIMPVHNQEHIIVKNIMSVLKCTTVKNYEIIIIMDACSDNTENELIKYIQTIDNSVYNLTDVLLLKTDTPLFETACDNVGFKHAKGIYVLEIQADMEMTEIGYNMRLLTPFLLDDNIIGISGRCCHDFNVANGIGKLGLRQNAAMRDLGIDINAYYIAETCNRGPLLLHADKLRKLGYLDEVNYFLDNSDHDLFARAYYLFKWTCGYIPIDYNSPLENGSTRKPRNKLNQHYYALKLEQTKGGVNGFLFNHNMQHRPIIKYKC